MPTIVRPLLCAQPPPSPHAQEPTAAELEPGMQAIVVSEETLPGATHINEGRQRRGFAPLQVRVVVPRSLGQAMQPRTK